MKKILMFLFCVTNLVAQNNTDKLNFNALEWRFIGPIIGNRGSVVISLPAEPNTFYHGAWNGLWKTEDTGTYWEPVGDTYFKYGSIGAMEFSESNPNIAYVGTGEAQMQINVSWGDGVYKTTNNGKTWTNAGLKETHHISQIRVHPTNPDIVYVGAFGHAFGPNPEHGVFKTIDGGNTWEKVLFKSDKAGVFDLSATILFKMTFMNGILDHSEGPVTQSMKTEFELLIEEANTANKKFNAAIEKEFDKFNTI